MEAIKKVEGRAIWLDMNNVDTDQVVPARFLRNPRNVGYAGFLFHDLRFDTAGAPKPEFVLNLPVNQGAHILAAGENFGGGSSREHAVYALFDWGIRAVIAPSFGDIFRNNCYKQGVLPIKLEEAQIKALLAQQDGGAPFVVDLPAQTVSCGSVSHKFAIEPFWKECLMEGVDDIDLTMREMGNIEAFAKTHFARFPWIPLDMAKWQSRRA